MLPIKTALLSFGMSGKLFHAPFIKAHKGFNLAGAYERSNKTIRTFYPDANSYNSIEELLSDESIELVVVNTPNITHFEYAKQALLAGKHVIVEKAFTTTAKEAIELKGLAIELNKKISVYQSRRWDSDFKTVQKVIQQKLLGEIIEAEIRFERYRPSLSYKQHKELPQPGAGLLNDLGPHLIDQSLCLFGMPTHLYATLRTTRPGSQVDDWFDILLYYSNLTVRIKSGYYYKEPMPGYILHGTRGSFIKTRADVQENQLLAGIQPFDSNWGVEPESDRGLLHIEDNGIITKERINTEKGNYLDYYNRIFEAIRNNGPLPVSCDEGIRVMQIIELSVISNQQGKKLSINEIKN